MKTVSFVSIFGRIQWHNKKHPAGGLSAPEPCVITFLHLIFFFLAYILNVDTSSEEDSGQDQ